MSVFFQTFKLSIKILCHLSDGFNTSAVGLHILGFPLGNQTKQWMAMLWTRNEGKLRENWIILEVDPSQNFGMFYQFLINLSKSIFCLDKYFLILYILFVSEIQI
jgi:hypothetical protein